MRTCLLLRPTIYAHAAPPRDNTNRIERALHECKDRWSTAYTVAQNKGLSAQRALRMASVAYKLAMPKMDTKPGIRAAIACIAQGIQLEVFDGRDGSQLLYAAQVALAAQKPPRLEKAKPEKTKPEKKCPPPLRRRLFPFSRPSPDVRGALRSDSGLFRCRFSHTQSMSHKSE